MLKNLFESVQFITLKRDRFFYLVEGLIMKILNGYKMVTNYKNAKIQNTKWLQNHIDNFKLVNKINNECL